MREASRPGLRLDPRHPPQGRGGMQDRVGSDPQTPSRAGWKWQGASSRRPHRPTVTLRPTPRGLTLARCPGPQTFRPHPRGPDPCPSSPTLRLHPQGPDPCPSSPTLRPHPQRLDPCLLTPALRPHPGQTPPPCTLCPRVPPWTPLLRPCSSALWAPPLALSRGCSPLHPFPFLISDDIVGTRWGGSHWFQGARTTI